MTAYLENVPKCLMPRIEHIAFWVEDLELMCRFYSEYFAATVGPRYENPQKGFMSQFLTFETGARIELMTTTRFTLPRNEVGAQRLGLTHLALSLGSTQAVDALTRKLKDAGVKVIDAPRHTGDGYYESVVLDPEGNRLELTSS